MGKDKGNDKGYDAFSKVMENMEQKELFNGADEEGNKKRSTTTRVDVGYTVGVALFHAVPNDQQKKFVESFERALMNMGTARNLRHPGAFAANIMTGVKEGYNNAHARWLARKKINASSSE
jgi:hypothetical protein